MLTPLNLDIDVLRTFATGSSLGSFAKAADKLGRSPAAVSLQMRKLESQVGQTLFRKNGRGLELTESGEAMLSYARRLLDLNDEAVLAMRRLAGMVGWVRLGLPQDFAETSLPALLGRFSRAYPGIRVAVRVERGSRLVELLNGGELDIALTWGKLTSPYYRVIGSYDVVWIGSDDFVRQADDMVSLVAFDPPCSFRARAIESMEGCGLPWQHVFASSGLAGLWAAVTAGLGITARIADIVPRHLRVLDPEGTGLPHLGALELCMHMSAANPVEPVQRFRELLVETLDRKR
ncbi:LysR substrate-binding domain-containing protein [Brucella intermedia]|uniref:LysR substrate-binding domain-containing protein n=1 Tax=Brucella intermedia TaxID=94625 RepID=UPI00224AA8A2|nr:LysR substrate-binding domain-containing protein [Brucella intermedia]